MAGQPGPTTHQYHLVRLAPPRRGWARGRSGFTPLLLAWLVAGVMSAALVGCVEDSPEVLTGDAQLMTGREVYTNNCVACHGAAGEGGTGPKLSDGTSIERFPDIQDHIDLIANGRNQMPAFGGKLSDDEIEAVVRYNREVL